MPRAFWLECLYSIACATGASFASSTIVWTVGWTIAGFLAGLAFAIYQIERAGL